MTIADLLEPAVQITAENLPPEKSATAATAAKPTVVKSAAAPVVRVEPGAIVYCRDKGNYGTVVADDGGPTVKVHFVSPDGNEATKDLPRGTLAAPDGTPLDPNAQPIIVPVNAHELLTTHSRLRKAVIHGLLRTGETLNIVSNSKIGKSWLVYLLLLAVALGRKWLDTFDCEQGRVLLLDNELHPGTLSHRMAAISSAMGLDDEWRKSVDIISLRGRLLDLYGLHATIHAIKPGTYSLVVADALYRFLPAGVDENSNAQVAQLYNAIDGYCEHLGAAWVNIHHASKGDQSGKAVIDVGAGAGSQSRAADSHLVLRPHQDDGVVVAEAVVRSFPPVDPVCIRWEYPLWTLASDSDPRRLRQPKNSQQAKQEAEDRAGKAKIVDIIRKVGKCPAGTLRTLTGMGKGRVDRLLAGMVDDGELTRIPVVVGGKDSYGYDFPAS